MCGMRWSWMAVKGMPSPPYQRLYQMRWISGLSMGMVRDKFRNGPQFSATKRDLQIKSNQTRANQMTSNLFVPLIPKYFPDLHRLETKIKIKII